MADKTSPPGDGQGDGAPDGTLDQRVDRLEAGQQSLSDKLDTIIGKLGGQGDDDGTPTAQASEPGGSPGGIAEEIRAQLEERDRRNAARAKDDERDGTIASLQQKVAELTEQQPQSMPRRVEKLMGWR